MKIKKIIGLTMLGVLMASNVVSIPVGAAEKKGGNSQIPEIMQPNTIIRYVSETDYEIISGGEKESIFATDLDNSFINMNIAVKESYLAPFEGMTIYYGTDGQLSEIKDENRIDIEGTVGLSADNAVLRVSSTISYPVSWGGKDGTNNILYKDGDDIVGEGRATTYKDEKGQANHTLVKGDVATKKAYDNCKNGITVYLTAHNVEKTGDSANGIVYKKLSTTSTVKMEKWDVGTMDNAIVDVWKSGCKYWGYEKYEENLSFLGRVTIRHANKF